MSDITKQLAEALARMTGMAEADALDDRSNEWRSAIILANEALAAYDTQQKRWTVFVRDAGNTGTTYITCVEAEDVEAAKAAASALCREDWGYDETDQLHILGVVAGSIGDVAEWDDCE